LLRIMQAKKEEEAHKSKKPTKLLNVPLTGYY